jgi:hypothetical protein
MARFEIVAGDGGSKIACTILDTRTNAPVDLNGKTATLRYSLNGAVPVERTMVVLNQSTNKGQAEYQFLTTDLPAAGELKGEVRLQAGLSDQLTTVDTFHLAIKAPLS